MNSLSNENNIKPPEEESSNYLFHYTDKLENIVSIMTEHFKPFFCVESIEFLGFTKSLINEMAYPVVCFCDLPLSRQKEHKVKFGDYGIAMNKQWGIDNLVTPVIYSHKKSMTALSLRLLIDMANQIQEKLPDEFGKFRNAVSILIMYYKAYEGRSYIKKEKKFAERPTRFYNEREWRYLPFEVDGLNWNLEVDQHQNDDTLSKENDIIQKKNRLKFGLNDIEFLFLKKEAEIEPFLSQMRLRYSEEETKLIKGKIQSF